jgi:hypothetical protein
MPYRRKRLPGKGDQVSGRARRLERIRAAAATELEVDAGRERQKRYARDTWGPGSFPVHCGGCNAPQGSWASAVWHGAI